MSPRIELVSTAADKARADLLAVPAFAAPSSDGKAARGRSGARSNASGAGIRLGPGAELVDRALGATLLAFATEAGFEGKRGDALAVPTAGRLGAKAAVLVGMGEPDAIDTDALRRAGAALARRSSKVERVATTLLDAAPASLDRGEAAQALAEGIALGSYQFLAYKSDAKPTRLARVQVLGRANAKVRGGLQRGTRIAEAVAWARDLVNEPAEAKSPDTVVRKARALARANGLTARVWSGEQLTRERLGGLLGVGAGSDRPPRFLRLAYEPRGAPATLALVGKGVVFDSGGLSIKTAGGMETMKTDMSGAAAVIAAMSALRDLGVKTRVLGYIPLVENMPSGNAMRPGDVLRIRNGKTVEVLNTDAEGRLILADALSLASEDGPDAIVDIATLTGAVTIALGEKIAALMGTSEDWNEQVRAAADRVGERAWPLPLPDDYRKLLESEVADMRNIGTGGGGGTITAGLFLREFVTGAPWVHLDVAGTARASADDGYISRGGTGYGVRTFIELASTFRKPKG
jgi:leucyl aminopeptidase